MPSKFQAHRMDVLIKKGVVDRRMVGRFRTYKDVLTAMQTRHGIDLSYKGFFNLLSNNITWKLLYAMSLASVLETTIDDLFEFKEVDIEKRKEKMLHMKEKYPPKEEIND